MSSIYHIDGQKYSADYIKQTYREHFEKASDTFCYYFGVSLPIHLEKISIDFPADESGITSRVKMARLGQPIIVNTELRFIQKTNPMSFDVYDISHVELAHELAEISFWNIRANLDNFDIITDTMSIFYRFLGETFAEIFKTIYCEKNKFKFKPIPLQSRFSRIFKGGKYPPDFETFYKPASILSKHMNKRPLKYRVSFLRALLFQNYDSLKGDIGSSIMNEGKKAIKYAIDRTYT